MDKDDHISRGVTEVQVERLHVRLYRSCKLHSNGGCTILKAWVVVGCMVGRGNKNHICTQTCTFGTIFSPVPDVDWLGVDVSQL